MIGALLPISVNQELLGGLQVNKNYDNKKSTDPLDQ